jgi:hypothetical protein
MVTFQVAGRGFFQDAARPVNVTFTTTASVPTQNRYNVHTRTYCNFINANWQITDINTPDTFGICQAGAVVGTGITLGFRTTEHTLNEQQNSLKTTEIGQG